MSALVLIIFQTVSTLIITQLKERNRPFGLPVVRNRRLPIINFSNKTSQQICRDLLAHLFFSILTMPSFFKCKGNTNLNAHSLVLVLTYFLMEGII